MVAGREILGEYFHHTVVEQLTFYASGILYNSAPKPFVGLGLKFWDFRCGDEGTEGLGERIRIFRGPSFASVVDLLCERAQGAWGSSTSSERTSCPASVPSRSAARPGGRRRSVADVTVPKGMVPGRAGYPFAFAGPSVCADGPNSSNLRPAAWVEVQVLPVDPTSVTPDAAGRLLHCLWTFWRPKVGIGKRRATEPQWKPNGVPDQDPIRVETDPGWFWVGTKASLSFVGGTVGDEYLVSVTYATPRDMLLPETEFEMVRGSLASGRIGAIDVYEDPFNVELSATFLDPPNGGFTDLVVPDYHTHFVNLCGGVAQVTNGLGVIRLGTHTKPIPLNLGQFQVQGGVFSTVGAV